MSAPRRPTRSGAALLLVLALLVTVVTAGAALASLASTERLRQRIEVQSELAVDLLAASGAPIVEWLIAESQGVSLPADAAEPRVAVLHDTWSRGGIVHALQITAWDQGGMVRPEDIKAGSPLRLAIPGEVRGVVDRVAVPKEAPLGLDDYLPEVAAGDAVVAVFPGAEHTTPARFGAEGAEGSFDGVETPDERSGPALGAFVATHGSGALNVNTAPIDLIEAAMRRMGRGGIEAIVAARARGEPASIPGRSPERARGRQPGRIGLRSGSEAWAFRIDARAGATRRSWWAVYEQRGSGWECVQRLAISR